MFIVIAHVFSFIMLHKARPKAKNGVQREKVSNMTRNFHA